MYFPPKNLKSVPSTSFNEDSPKIEDDPKNEDNPKNKDNLKDECDLKN